MSNSPLLQTLRDRIGDYEARTIDGDYPDAAVVVAVNNSDRPGVLLTQRSPNLSLHAGEIAFPGGKEDDDDHDLLHTAVREMEEEVGVAADQFECLGPLDQRITRTNIRMTPYLGILSAGLDFEINYGELDAAFYVPLDELIDGRLFSVVEVLDKGITKRVARFQFQEYDIWGVTAMVLADMLNELLDANLPIETRTGEK
ncbi:8-oxo-dGTP pyrophosphatase MutT (NUDIX family) [Litorivivens lipolytica]|uniref:8-oxo-dGTP pyrophosphatase MutT (NUDIX family) n=1 Tax=Litorivivens lipolytica TaxID=1524264 RepID=A0A7W4W1S2_9GAMM|nr:CoA pyrophosphatase [Litorivivens lipolytica]MBB3045848.1 8-oxo-dGTP pyrophosphatase MutT (NUDIX family) [Litorivivens lipolytica]